MGRNGLRRRTNRLNDDHDIGSREVSEMLTPTIEGLSTQSVEEVVCPAVENIRGKMAIYYNYGGYFMLSPSRKYVNGQLLKNNGVDIDFICFFDMLDDLKEKCNFKILEGDKFFYLRGDRVLDDIDGLVQIQDDSDVQNMLHSYKMHKEKPIEIYTLSEYYDIVASTPEENNYQNNVVEELIQPVEGGHNSSDGIELNSRGSSAVKRKTRGPTRSMKIVNLGEGEKLQVEFDEDNQVVGENSTHFIWFLGQTVRNRACCPLKVDGWKEIKPESIDHMWKIIMEKFDFEEPEEKKGAIVGHMSDLYRDYRSKLKRKYFETKGSYQLRLKNKPKHITTDDWKYLVNFWSGADFQKRSMQNKANRSKRSLPPYTGTKSYARLRKEMHDRNGVIPSRVGLFKEARKRKSGKKLDDFQQNVIDQFNKLEKQREKGEISIGDDEMFAEVLGEETNGFLRGYGPGKSITEYFGGRRTKRELIKQVEAARKEANERVEKAKRDAEEKLEQYKKETKDQFVEMESRWEEKFRMMATQGPQCSNVTNSMLMEEPRNDQDGMDMIQ